jgi:hypothetical protein
MSPKPGSSGVHCCALQRCGHQSTLLCCLLVAGCPAVHPVHHAVHALDRSTALQSDHTHSLLDRRAEQQRPHQRVRPGVQRQGRPTGAIRTLAMGCLSLTPLQELNCAQAAADGLVAAWGMWIVLGATCTACLAAFGILCGDAVMMIACRNAYCS